METGEPGEGPEDDDDAEEAPKGVTTNAVMEGLQMLGQMMAQQRILAQAWRRRYRPPRRSCAVLMGGRWASGWCNGRDIPLTIHHNRPQWQKGDALTHGKRHLSQIQGSPPPQGSANTNMSSGTVKVRAGRYRDLHLSGDARISVLADRPGRDRRDPRDQDIHKRHLPTRQTAPIPPCPGPRSRRWWSTSTRALRAPCA